jgi:hypothetical protein
VVDPLQEARDGIDPLVDDLLRNQQHLTVIARNAMIINGVIRLNAITYSSFTIISRK